MKKVMRKWSALNFEIEKNWKKKFEIEKNWKKLKKKILTKEILSVKCQTYKSTWRFKGSLNESVRVEQMLQSLLGLL